MAKGIRKITSKRACALELFSQVTMMVVPTKGMDIITEVRLDNHHLCFSTDYLKTSIAYQLIELVDKLSAENESNEDLYALLTKALAFIKATPISKEKMDAIAIRFKTRILELLGFGLPKYQSLEELTSYIEEIIEKKLVSRRHFEV